MKGRSLRRLAPLAAAFAFLALVLFGAGTALAGEKGTSLMRLSPEDIGGPDGYGREVDHLYEVILWITIVTFVLTEGLLLFFVLKFRAKPGGKAVYTHGNHKLEVIWTIVPGAILFWLALYQVGTWKDIKIERPDPKEGLVVQVLAKQFEWHFRYAGPDGAFGTEDDVSSLNFLHVPVDTKVTVQIRSLDVLHSFFLPNLRLKQDAVPGLTINQWFEAKKTTEQSRQERGDENFHFEIACAELCGVLHTRMKGYLVVHAKDDFFAWIDKDFVENIRPYGADPENPVNKYWPTKEKDPNQIYEDPWLRDNWPQALKDKWPKDGE